MTQIVTGMSPGAARPLVLVGAWVALSMQMTWARSFTADEYAPLEDGQEVFLS